MRTTAWLMSRAVDADGPFGYDAFAKSVGALVMGSATYEWVVAHQPGDWPYEQPTWVLTHRPQIVVAGHPVQTFDGDVADLHPNWWRRPSARTYGWSVAERPRRSSSRRSCRRNDRHLRAMLAGRRRRAGAPLRSEWTLAESAVNGDFVCARWTRAST